MTLPLVVRPARASDRGYVLKNWLRSYAESRFAREAGKPYWRGEARLIDRHIERGEVNVAAYAEDDDVIAGFICASYRVLHFVFVTESYRRKGIAKMLVDSLSAEPDVYSRRTPLLGSIRLPPTWRYDLYAGILNER